MFLFAHLKGGGLGVVSAWGGRGDVCWRCLFWTDPSKSLKKSLKNKRQLGMAL